MVSYIQAAPSDAPVVDTAEQVYISSLALLKVLHFVQKVNNKQSLDEVFVGAILEYPAIFFHGINLWIPQSRSRKLSEIQGMCN